jgi:hypothetical protein
MRFGVFVVRQMRFAILVMSVLMEPATARPNITVPVFLPFQAPSYIPLPPFLSVYGLPAIRRMAQLARDDVNANPALLPNHTLELDFYDTQGDIGEGIKALQRTDFLEAYPGMLGTLLSGVSVPIASVTGAFFKPMLNWCAGSDRLTDRDAYPYFNRIMKLPYDVNTWLSIVKLYGWTTVNVMHYVTEAAALEYLATYGATIVADLRAANVTVEPIPIRYDDASCVKDADAEAAMDQLALSDSRILFYFATGPVDCGVDTLLGKYEARGFTGQYQMLIAEADFKLDVYKAHAAAINRSLAIAPVWSYKLQPSTSKLNTFIDQRLSPGYGDWFTSELNGTKYYDDTIMLPWGVPGPPDSFPKSFMPLTCGYLVYDAVVHFARALDATILSGADVLNGPVLLQNMRSLPIAPDLTLNPATVRADGEADGDMDVLEYAYGSRTAVDEHYRTVGVHRLEDTPHLTMQTGFDGPEFARGDFEPGPDVKAPLQQQVPRVGDLSATTAAVEWTALYLRGASLTASEVVLRLGAATSWTIAVPPDGSAGDELAVTVDPPGRTITAELVAVSSTTSSNARFEILVKDLSPGSSYAVSCRVSTRGGWAEESDATTFATRSAADKDDADENLLRWLIPVVVIIPLGAIAAFVVVRRRRRGEVFLLRESRRPPALTLAQGMKWHTFVSHTWKDEKATRTHLCFRSADHSIHQLAPFPRSRGRTRPRSSSANSAPTCLQCQSFSMSMTWTIYPSSRSTSHRRTQ